MSIKSLLMTIAAAGALALSMQAATGSGRYAAEARVEYARVGTGWKIKQVGLLSIAKIE